MAERKFMSTGPAARTSLHDECTGGDDKYRSIACDVPSQCARLSQGDGVLTLNCLACVAKLAPRSQLLSAINLFTIYYFLLNLGRVEE